MFFKRQGLIVPNHQNSGNIEDEFVGLFIVCMIIDLLHVHLFYKGLESLDIHTDGCNIMPWCEGGSTC